VSSASPAGAEPESATPAPAVPTPPTRLAGTVRQYDRTLCWGFITGDDGRGYFVPKFEIRDGGLERLLTRGERVTFEPQESPRGPRAAGVRRERAPASS
jgi:cold shock CspA family protein